MKLREDVEPGRERDTLRAARTPSGSASTIARIVPSVAMWNVSISVSCTTLG